MRMKVKLFGGLRNITGNAQIEASGERIREVLENICAENKSLHTAFFESNELHPHVQVILNGRDSELRQGLETPVSTIDQMAIFPPIAGGY